MKTIDKDIVERTWKTIGAMDGSQASEVIGLVGEEQPAMLAYVRAAAEAASKDGMELIVYMFTVVYHMFRSAYGMPIPRVSSSRMERTAADVMKRMGALGEAHERFFQRNAEVTASRQPHVCEYVTSAIMEKEDPDLHLTKEDEGLAFLVLMTAITALDAVAH